MSDDVPDRIFHIATDADWRRTLETGTYTTSTVGRTLAEEGFVHASRRDQVQGVFDRYYAGLDEHLVLLTIDPRRLDAEVRVDPVGDDTYPHVYGPINRSAVVDAVQAIVDRSDEADQILLATIALLAERYEGGVGLRFVEEGVFSDGPWAGARGDVTGEVPIRYDEIGRAHV